MLLVHRMEDVLDVSQGIILMLRLNVFCCLRIVLVPIFKDTALLVEMVLHYLELSA